MKYKYQDLIKQIRKQQFAPVYYFTGPETTIARMMEKQLVKAVVPEGMEQLNVMTFKEKLTDVSDVMSIARQLPLMSPYRVVIVREETGLCHTADAQLIDPLMSYLKKPEPTTILILCDTKPDKRKKIYKAIQKTATVVTFEQLTLVELENWIAQRLKRAGKKIGTRTLKYLIEKTRYLDSEDVNMAMIDNRVAQLIDFAGDAEIIDRAAIDEVVPVAIDDHIFRMIDFAIQGRTADVLTMLQQFYLQGESPFGIFGLLSGQIRTMLQVRILADKRTPVNLIAKQVGRPNFVVKKMARAGNRFGKKRLMTLMTQLSDLDYQMKTGQVDPQTGIELFVMRLA